MAHPDHLTVRGIDRALLRELRRTAHELGLSLNKAALVLMRRGAGLVSTPKAAGIAAGKIGDSLDAQIGTWSEEEARELLHSIDLCEQIDPELWGETTPRHQRLRRA